MLPGVSLNVSKSGVSTSIGTKDATINVGKSAVRGTAGIPGAGISVSEKLSDGRTSRPPQIYTKMGFGKLPMLGILALLVGIVIFGEVTG